MAKISAKGAVITVNSQAHSTYISSYSIEWGQDVPEVTGFSDGWQNYLAGGMPVVGLTFDYFWEATASTGVLAILRGMMTTPATIVITPESGAAAISGTFMCDGIKPTGTASSGAITMPGVHFSASGTSIATFTS